jgi:release factor glutamine methyltransferase
VSAAAEGWDLVVANPPYVRSLEDLQPELRWEPQVALVGRGEHERLARAAKARFAVFEVGDDQAQEVAEILDAAGWRDVRVTEDLTGTERVVEGAK